MRIKTVIICLFLFSSVFFSPPKAFARRIIPDDLVRYPVLVTLDNGASASGFYFNREDGAAYFVTTKHNLFKKNEAKTADVLRAEKALLLSYPRETEIKNPIYIELNLTELYQNSSVQMHETADVAVVRIGQITQGEKKKFLKFVKGVEQRIKSGQNPEGTILGASPDMVKRYDEVLIGNEVFIFGYPVSLGIGQYLQVDYVKPLLKKGVISGKNDEKKTIILDCSVHFGNSGGPVIEVEPLSLTETKFWMIGMISEFIPFDEQLYTGKRSLLGRQIENSGYSVVIPMDTVLELIGAQAMREGESKKVS